MQSLRTILPDVCDILGITLDQAYERQRVLVKAGILKPRPGRGPGSGVPSTAQNLATLLIALLLGDLREHAVSTVKAIANAKPLGGTNLYGEARFGDVLAIILDTDPTKQSAATRPAKIRILRDSVEAEIEYERIGKPQAPFWSKNYSVKYRTRPMAPLAPQRPRKLREQAVLDGDALPELHRVLSNANDGATP